MKAVSAVAPWTPCETSSPGARLRTYISGNNFGGAPTHPKIHNNRRSELYEKGREWLRTTGTLDPNCPITERYLIPELCSVGYRYVAGRLQMEAKEVVRKRLGRSTDVADA